MKNVKHIALGTKYESPTFIPLNALRAVDTDQKITLPSRLYSSEAALLKAVDTDQKIALSLTQSYVTLVGIHTYVTVSLWYTIMKLVGILLIGLLSSQVGLPLVSASVN